MKKLISFLSYHNAVPLAAVVLTMGAGITFAASQGVLPLSPIASLPASDSLAPESVDASALRVLDLDAFDFRPTVTGVVETDMLYTISYSIDTLAPEDGAWVAYEKAGEFSVAKDALDDTGLQGYVVAKLHDIENGERSYLVRAQTAEKALAQTREAQPASAFAALVGLALDQIPVPIVQKLAPETPVQSQTMQKVASEQTPQTTTTDLASADVPAAGVVASTSTSTILIADPIGRTASSTAASEDTDVSAQVPVATDATSTPMQEADLVPAAANSAATSTPGSN